ncbi:MAG: hypothetical protein KKH12_03605 [Gammaproteobacteria bacterium]|nr:hypothetical protein [Gammaproteobacteria bacterium]MBU1480741.1 hypothetical protein [Gammaproteobacteria bacterium]
MSNDDFFPVRPFIIISFNVIELSAKKLIFQYGSGKLQGTLKGGADTMGIYPHNQYAIRLIALFFRGVLREPLKRKREKKGRIYLPMPGVETNLSSFCVVFICQFSGCPGLEFGQKDHADCFGINMALRH